MYSFLKYVCLSAVVAIACLTASPVAQTGVFFQNSWDNNGATGCDFPRLTDNSAWDDYGPGSTCNANPHVADIVTDERVNGTSSLRVNFVPDGTLNGPDFRIVKAWGTNNSTTYARWYVKYSNNWVWASADHKVAIFGNAAQTSQDIYYNIRGNGGGGPSGRVVIGVTPTDTVLADPSVAITPGVWHLCEIRIVSGTNGSVQAKLDGRLLNLQYEAGRQASASNLNTGVGIGFIKLDTTYNNYAYPSSRGLYMNTWFDAVAVSTTGWIGGVGGTPPPPDPPPAAPLNVRVIRQ